MNRAPARITGCQATIAWPRFSRGIQAAVPAIQGRRRLFMGKLSSGTSSRISRRRLVQGAAALGVAMPLAAAGGRLHVVAQEGRNSVVWVSPRGTLEVLDDYPYWVAKRF